MGRFLSVILMVLAACNRQPPAACSPDPRLEIRDRVDRMMAHARPLVELDLERFKQFLESEIDLMLEACLNDYVRPPLEELRQLLASVDPPPSARLTGWIPVPEAAT
jgi:hypothetical protein